MDKISVTQDYLYEYIKAHDINVCRFAELMGVSNAIVTMSFKHNPNRHGKPMKFSESNLQKLNDALSVFSQQINECRIFFGSNEMFTNRLGRTYDPGVIKQLMSLSKMFNVKGLTNRILGWNRGKYDLVLCSPSSKVYGFITADDVMRINAELLAVSGTLSGIKVSVANDSESKETETVEPCVFTEAELDAYEDQLLNGDS